MRLPRSCHTTAAPKSCCGRDPQEALPAYPTAEKDAPGQGNTHEEFMHSQRSSSPDFSNTFCSHSSPEFTSGQLHVHALSLIQGSSSKEVPHSIPGTRHSWPDACCLHTLLPPDVSSCVKRSGRHCCNGPGPERSSQPVLTHTCKPPLTSFTGPAAISCCLKYKYPLEEAHNQGKVHR